jgi:hypothetical protein
MGEEMLPKIDYYLDESDPDVVVLRRQDGAFVAAFSARGATREGIAEAAKEDYRQLVSRLRAGKEQEVSSEFPVRPGQDCVELVLSGGPDPTDPLWVDDDLSVFLNTNAILVDDNEHADEDLGTVSFTAKNRDRLRVVARDVHTGCRSRSPLYLHSTSDGTLHLLAPEIIDRTGKPAPAVFYDKTFDITLVKR